MRHRPAAIPAALAAACLLTASVAPAQPWTGPTSLSPSTAEEGIHLSGSRSVSGTWVQTDSKGYRWDITNNGRVSDGTKDAYDGGMQLQVNGSSFSGSGSARMSKDGSEIEIGPWSSSGLSIWRRIYVNSKAGYCRWIDIFENNSSRPRSVSLRYNFNMGASTGFTRTTSGGASPTKKDWGIVTSGSSSSSSRPAIVHVFASPAARFKPRFQFTTGNDYLYYHANITVPPGKPVALCFFEAQRRARSEAIGFFKEFRLERELGRIPAPLRKILLNMSGVSLTLGSIELRRSAESDLVILSNGDEFRCTISNREYVLQTSFGLVTLPAEGVIALARRSADENRVHLFLTDGQVIAGGLRNGPLVLKLTGGTELKIPPKGLRQAAYRITPSKPGKILTTGTLVVLRRGERLAPAGDGLKVNFLTAHGELSLQGADLSRVLMDTPSGGLHRAVFRNGSTLAGLLKSERLTLKLKFGMNATFPRQQVQQLVFVTEKASSSGLAKLTLRNGDVLYGRITDERWTVKGKFGDVVVRCAELAKAEFSFTAFGHAKLELRKGTRLGGKLAREYVGFRIEPGPQMKVFVGRIAAISIPLPGEKPAEEPSATQPVTRRAATAKERAKREKREKAEAAQRAAERAKRAKLEAIRRELEMRRRVRAR